METLALGEGEPEIDSEVGATPQATSADSKKQMPVFAERLLEMQYEELFGRWVIALN